MPHKPSYEVTRYSTSKGEFCVGTDTSAIAASHRGWVMGPFVTDTLGREIADCPFEFKFGVHKQGENSGTWKTQEKGYSLVVMISGQMRQSF